MAIPNIFDDNLDSSLPAPKPVAELPDIFAEDFSDVETSVESTEASSGLESFFAPPHMQQGAKETGQLVDVAQGGVQNLAAGVMEQAPRVESPLTKIVARQGAMYDSLARGDLAGVFDAVTAPLKEVTQRTGDRLRADAATNAASGVALKKEYADGAWVERQLMEGSVDALSSPSGWMSLIGGPAGAIAMGDAYAQAYNQGKESGLEGEELEAFAIGQSAPEAIAFVPAGQLLSKLPWLGPMLKKKAADYAGRRAAEATGGVMTRLTSPAAAAGAAVARTAAGEAVEEATTAGMQDLVLQAQAGQDFYDNLAGVAEKGRANSLEEFGERVGQGARAGLLMGGVGGTVAGVSAAGDATRDMNERSDRVAETLLAEQRRRAEAVVPPAPVVPEPAPTPAPAQERPRARWDEASQTWVAAPAPTQAAPVEAPAQPEAAPKPASDPQRKSELGRIHAAKRKAGLDDAAYRALLQSTTGKDSAAKLSAPERQQVMAALGADNEAAPAQARAKAKSGIDAELERMKNELGSLGQQGETSAAPAEFEQKTRRAVDNLVRSNRQQDVDVLNLLQQRKLVFAPNAASIGREESNNGAEYDIGTGEMFVYTDKLDTDNLAEVIAAANHESGHGGQFNDRQGRPDILRYMMGNEEWENVNSRIKSLARDGNKVAGEAVALAKAAAGENASVEELEIVPYLATAVARSRGKSLGRLSGVWQDANASLRAFGRDKLKMKNLDFDMNELMKASQQFAGEAVQTEMSGPQTEEGSLGMVGGRSASDFEQFSNDNLLYTGTADGLERFEFSDSDSTVSLSDDTRTALVGGKKIKLKDILKHDTLYNNYPGLANVNVYAGTNPAYVGMLTAKEEIELGPRLVNQLSKGITGGTRSTLLHEIQHWIQHREGFAGGATVYQFVKPRIAQEREEASKALDRMTKGLDLTYAVATLPPDVRQQWSSSLPTGWTAVENDSPESIDAMLKERMLSEYAGRSRDPDVQRRAARYQQALDTYDKADKEYQQDYLAALDTYMRSAGETEARNTQLRSELPQSSLDEAIRAGQSPESTFPFTNDFNNEVEDFETADVVNTDRYRLGQKAPNAEERAARVSARQAAERELPGVLGMASDPKARIQSKIPPVVFSLLSNSQGTGRQINAIAEQARNSPAAVKMEAEGYMGKYKHELKALADRKGLTTQQLSEQIAKAIDAVDSKSDSYQENLDAFVKAVKPFGAVGQVLVDFRNSVDALSLDILRQRFATGVPLTKTEKKVYSTVMNNLGRYAHRQFAANLRDGTYSDTIWSDYQAYKQKGAKDITPAQRKNARRVVNALERLVDQITIPTPKVLANLSVEKVNRLYDTWGENRNPDALTAEDKRAELDAMRDRINGDTTAMQDQAESVAQQILGIMDDGQQGMIASYYRGGKQDQGILQTRKKISPEIRELMGEIKDPGMRLFTTAAKQAEFVARTKMLMTLAEIDDPYHVQPPGPSGRPEVKGMKQLKGDAYGPLNNFYVSPELFNLVSDSIEHLATFEQAVAMAATRPKPLIDKALSSGLGAWGQLASTTKLLQIVGTPAYYLMNFMGGGAMLLQNGNLNPKHVGTALTTAGELIRYAANPGKGSDRAKRVAALGITDSAFVGEINSERHREMQQVIKEMVGKPPSAFVNAMHKAKFTTKEIYAMMDVVFKIANFYQQADAVLPEFYKKAGITKTQAEIDTEAADITNRTNISYTRAPPFIKALERAGFTQFATYFWEVFRTQVSNMRQGFEEIARAQSAPNAESANVMRAQAARRIGGQLLTWGLVAKAAQMMGEAAFGDDEEDKYKRYLLPDYIRSHDFVDVGKDKEGDQVFFEWSRFDPFGPATDIMRRIVAEGDISPAELAGEIFDLYIAPRIGTRLVQAALATVGMETRTPTKPMVQQLFPEAFENVALPVGSALLPGDNNDRATKAWVGVGETFIPGWSRALSPTNPRPEVEDLPSAVASMMKMGGATLYKFDPGRQASRVAFEYNDLLKRERALIGELSEDRPNADEAFIGKRLAGAKQRELEAFTEIRNVYRGMRAIGMSEEESLATLKDRKVPTEILPQLVSGKFESRVVSEESFEQRKANAVRKAPKSEKEKVEKRWDDMWKLIEGVESND